MIEEEGLDNILARHHYGARGSGAPVRAERSVTLKTTASSEPQQRENRAHRNQGQGVRRSYCERYRLPADSFMFLVDCDIGALAPRYAK
jgi:hypothetical protein